MSKRRFKVFKRHRPEDWMVVTRWNGWPISTIVSVPSVLLTTTFMNDYIRKWKPPDHVSY